MTLSSSFNTARLDSQHETRENDEKNEWHKKQHRFL